MDVRRRGRGLARWIGAAAALALQAGPLTASGVDGAGKTVVVPLAFTGQPRESVFTVTNPNPEPVHLTVTYVGAEGTPNAASVRQPIPCDDQDVPPRGSLTLELAKLCPDATGQDSENFGYVVFVAHADAHENVFVTTVVDGSLGVSSGIDGQPIGDHDPGFAPKETLGLEVGGLRQRQNQFERPVCFVATLSEAKKVRLNVLDRTGTPLAGGTTLSLAAERMQRIDLESALGLGAVDRDDLRLVASSADPGLLILGCGGEMVASKAVGYLPAQTPEPADRARLHDVTVHADMRPGPYSIGYPWWHTAFHDPADRKVQLTTYLRPDDAVRCWLENWDNDPQGELWPYVELQVLDPTFRVIAGGSLVKNTGTFRTPSRGALPSAAGDRYLIEVSYDESTGWPQWPTYKPRVGAWQVHCTSAAGMSEPIPVPSTALDDF